jgi:hypothetical protein
MQASSQYEMQYNLKPGPTTRWEPMLVPSAAGPSRPRSPHRELRSSHDPTRRCRGNFAPVRRRKHSPRRSSSSDSLNSSGLPANEIYPEEIFESQFNSRRRGPHLSQNRNDVHQRPLSHLPESDSQPLFYDAHSPKLAEKAGGIAPCSPNNSPSRKGERQHSGNGNEKKRSSDGDGAINAGPSFLTRRKYTESKEWSGIHTQSLPPRCHLSPGHVSPKLLNTPVAPESEKSGTEADHLVLDVYAAPLPPPDMLSIRNAASRLLMKSGSESLSLSSEPMELDLSEITPAFEAMSDDQQTSLPSRPNNGVDFFRQRLVDRLASEKGAAPVTCVRHRHTTECGGEESMFGDHEHSTRFDEVSTVHSDARPLCPSNVGAPSVTSRGRGVASAATPETTSAFANVAVEARLRLLKSRIRAAKELETNRAVSSSSNPRPGQVISSVLQPVSSLGSPQWENNSESTSNSTAPKQGSPNAFPVSSNREDTRNSRSPSQDRTETLADEAALRQILLQRRKSGAVAR